MNSRRRDVVSAIASMAILCICGCGGSNPAAPTGQSKAVAPRTLHVALSGSDQNSGTTDSPWLTIRYAVSQMHGGDTLLIRGGIYTGAANVIDSEQDVVPSGSSWSNAVTIAAYPGERVTLQPPDGRQAIRLTSSAPHFLVFEDLVLDMSRQTAGGSGGGPSAVYLSGGAHHNRFRRLEVMNNQGNGIMFSDNNGNSPFNEVLDSSLHDNGRYPGLNEGYGAYVFTSDNVFEGNDIFNNGGYGLHFFSNKPGSDVSRNVIRNNRIHGNGTQGGTNYGIVVASGDANVIRENAVYDNRGGIMVYERSSNTLVENNTIYNNAPLEGILVQGAMNTTIRANTIYANGTDIRDAGSRTIVTGTVGH
jgi:parallel beta-helix repeat protein